MAMHVREQRGSCGPAEISRVENEIGDQQINLSGQNLSASTLPPA